MSLSIAPTTMPTACNARTRLRYSLVSLLCLMLAMALVLPAHAARVALVIGNAAYQDRPLKNPTNDAQDLAAALTASGFQVTLKQNLGADAMKEAISEFGDALRRDGGTGLFYFSGHGVQTPKGNYLLPVGRSFKRVKDVELFAVEARSVLSEMQQARNPLNILILDACRDSPLPAEARGEGNNKGLARMDAPSGSVIAFATAPGNTASDNSAGRNGLYTKHLIAAINTPGLRLEDVFKRVGAAVEKESRQQNGDQSPEEVMKLRSEQPFYFQTASLRPEPVPGPSAAQVEQQAWSAAQRANTVPAYNAYLSEYPSGSYASAARVARAGLEPVPRVTEPSPQPQPVGPAPTTPTAGSTLKGCADCPELVVIPAGSFQMGSNDGNKNEKPIHSVSVKGFALGKYEVTQGQWKAVMGSNPSKFKECGDTCPVENVSWDDIQQYIQKLNQKTGQQYRLPSEAEWEYAARAGTTTNYWWGNDESDGYANSGQYNCCGGLALGRDHWQNTAPVGKFPANAFGLHDLHGNVFEWVQDYSHDSYSGAPVDGSAWLTGGDQKSRVLRGGSWYSDPASLRSAYRWRLTQDSRQYNAGFRLARTLLTP